MTDIIYMVFISVRIHIYLNFIFKGLDFIIKDLINHLFDMLLLQQNYMELILKIFNGFLVRYYFFPDIFILVNK